MEAVWEVLSKGSKWKRSRSLLSQASSDFEMEEAEADESYILISDEEWECFWTTNKLFL
jgi:hypothetical protein